jgi:hypothetical protein
MDTYREEVDAELTLCWGCSSSLIRAQENEILKMKHFAPYSYWDPSLAVEST